jgi:hypothetical protein
MALTSYSEGARVQYPTNRMEFKSSILLAILFVFVLVISNISGPVMNLEKIGMASYAQHATSQSYSVLNQSASWSIGWDNSVEETCSGTPPSGTLYVYTDNMITKIGPSGQEWEVALPQNYFLLSSPGFNSFCTVSSVGNVYMYGGGSSGYSVFALNAEGVFQWIYTPTELKMTGISSQAGVNGDIYVTGFASCYCDQIIIAVSPSGVQLWNSTAPLSQNGVAASSLVPVISPNGTIFVTIEGFRGGTELVALAPNNGTTEWSYVFNTENNLFGPLFVPDGTIYVNAETTLFAFTPEGAIKWQATLPGDLGEPSFPGQMLYNSNSTLLINFESPSFILELNSSTGQQIWNATVNSNLIYVSWILGVTPDGTIFVQQFLNHNGIMMNGSSLFGYAANGSQSWSMEANLRPLPGAGSTESGLLVDNDGDALVMAPNNTLYAVDDNGSAVWQFPLLPTLPVSGIDPGQPMYILQSQSNESVLYAINGLPYAPLSITTSTITLTTVSSQTSESSTGNGYQYTTTTQSTAISVSRNAAPAPGLDLTEITDIVVIAVIVVTCLIFWFNRR